jgi:hypothetical protein
MASGYARVGTGPAPQSVFLPAGEFSSTFTYVDPSPPVVFGILAATQIVGVHNGAGTVGAGDGPGTFSRVAPSPLSGTQMITPGAAQFGGILPIVQDFEYNAIRQTTFGGFLVGTTGNVHTAGGGFKVQQQPNSLTTATGTVNNLNPGTGMIPYNIAITLGTWTTGQVIVNNAAAFTTTITVTGSDARTPSGHNGTLQLVTPFTFNQIVAGTPAAAGSAYEILSFEFVPEPASTALLAGGLGSIVLLAVIDRRRQRRPRR